MRKSHSNFMSQSGGARMEQWAVVRALASHQCGPGSNPSVDAICGLSLLLALSLLREVFHQVIRFPPLIKGQPFQISI